jgi:predicted proteasome-type protease
MTYCLALRLDDGLVFMADKRSIRPSRLTSMCTSSPG